jgi:glycosyltransferase involved in cell wall biosynthesis
MNPVIAPAIAYDLTRLLLGPTLPVPRGIDRVDLGYARYFLESWHGECVGTLPLPLGLLGGVLVIERASALKLLDLIADTWGETGLPDGDPALAHVKARLADPQSDLAQPNPPYHFRPHRIVTSLLQALFRMGFKGLRLRSSIARGAIYVNTGQLGLAFPWATAWLDRRPDIRRVYMLHDVIPLDYPELVTPSGTRLHARMIDNTARRADGLIVTTEDVRRSVLRELAKCRRHHIPTLAAPLPVAPLFLAPEPLDAELSGSRYFVIVGSIEPRKNHALLVDVWMRLVAQDRPAPKLVIVGTPWRDAESVLGSIAMSDRLRRAVILVTGLTSPALRRLIQGAEALLVPSFIEGFGLPIVEALALGTPVIASDLPAHREAGGGFVTYLDPRDADAWEAAIGQQLEAPQAQRELLKNYDPWDWGDYAACLTPFLIGMTQQPSAATFK